MQSFYSLLWYCHFCIHTLLSGHLSNLLLCIHNCGIDQDLEGVLALQAPDSHFGNSPLRLLLRSSLTPTGTHFLTWGLYHFWASDRFWQLVHWPSHSPFYRFFNFFMSPNMLISQHSWDHVVPEFPSLCLPWVTSSQTSNHALQWLSAQSLSAHHVQCWTPPFCHGML